MKQTLKKKQKIKTDYNIIHINKDGKVVNFEDLVVPAHITKQVLAIMNGEV
ncbi:gp38 [Brochothrix phage BL3]|uniref:gp38 n=1 Tax=Brochothrix phage BL3 TaxID=764562 RepID=UPI0001D9ADCF|nr:gp38 [Brochothrix phage BL3]ADH03119.1 gp38 [Brochothrix phage BL3]